MDFASEECFPALRLAVFLPLRALFFFFLDAFTLFFFFRIFASLRLVSRGRFLERESLDVEDSESEEDEDEALHKVQNIKRTFLGM